MKPTPQHEPCSTCAKLGDGKCAETHAVAIPSAGRRCPMYRAGEKAAA